MYDKRDAAFNEFSKNHNKWDYTFTEIQEAYNQGWADYKKAMYEHLIGLKGYNTGVTTKIRDIEDIL